MLFKIWDEIRKHLSEKPYWAKLKPFFTFLSAYGAAHVLTYQYLEWQYHISPTISLYVHSYYFRAISLVFVALAVLLIGLAMQGKKRGAGEASRAWSFLHESLRRIWPKAVLVTVLLAITVPLVYSIMPRKVSHIRVKFLTEPEPQFDRFALVYLLYEINKLQDSWYFEIDFDVFNEALLTSKEREACAGENKALCYAEILSKEKPLIGITKEQLGRDFFWQNRERVSVISSFNWELFSPPSVYEYLAYSIIVQSILIHLNCHCSGLPKDAFRESPVGYGDLFQFVPQRNAIKAQILAAHLNERGQQLILNCFGAKYLSVCSQLLNLEWLHSERVVKNLEEAFKVKLEKVGDKNGG